jgi:hypothetical protein
MYLPSNLIAGGGDVVSDVVGVGVGTDIGIGVGTDVGIGVGVGVV